MVVGFTGFGAERPNTHSRAKRSRDGAMFFDRSRLGEKSVSDSVDVGSGAPRVNAFCAANLMRWRAIAAVRGDEYWRAYFMAKIL